MTPDLIQERVLGAIRFLDGTTLEKVQSQLAVTAANALVRPNRSAVYVIWNAPSGGVVFTVSDPTGVYLARKFSLVLPRDLDPAHADQPTSIFQPLDVALFPSPTAFTSPGWAVIRASVKNAATDSGLSGALVLVTRTSDGKQLAAGMSDSRGESLVRVPGVPVTTFDSGSVTATEIDVTLQAVFDPTLTDIPDPDDLAARKNTLPSVTTPAKLASGGLLVVKLAVTVP